MESGRALPKVSGRNSVRNPDVKDIKENITKTDSRLYLPNSRPIIGANTAPTLAIEEQVPIPVFLKYCERIKIKNTTFLLAHQQSMRKILRLKLAITI